MEKLVFDYTYDSFPESWDWDLPFEYESKDKFIFDVLENPMLLSKIGITVWEYMIEDGSIYKEDYMVNLEQYVFTLDEWFMRNRYIIK